MNIYALDEKGFENIISRIWPNCGRIVAAGTGAFSIYTRKLRFYSGAIPMNNGFYAASEAVIGRSLVIGRPVAMLLLARNATLTMCHTKTRELAATCRAAELLVVASGHAGVVGPEFTNPDQVVIDVGINASPDGGLCGDVQYDAVAPVVRAITPVPAGVGSVTTAVLCKHVIEAAEALGNAK